MLLQLPDEEQSINIVPVPNTSASDVTRYIVRHCQTLYSARRVCSCSPHRFTLRDFCRRKLSSRPLLRVRCQQTGSNLVVYSVAVVQPTENYYEVRTAYVGRPLMFLPLSLCRPT